jgi:DNA-binding CsgD family transcriptional regulator
MNMFREALILLRRAKKEKARSLQFRLFAFFALFAIVLVGGGFLAMTFTGVFNAAERRHLTWLQNETEHLKASVSSDFSMLSLRGLALSRNLTSSISLWAVRNGIAENNIVDSIASRSDLIESLLLEEAGQLIAVLQNNVCSGIFLILDNEASGAEMRTGLYFKRLAANNIASLSPKIYCLRGPASIARANQAELIGQWRAGFDVNDMDFYKTIIETARQNEGMNLSRLYYWSERYLMEGDSEYSVCLSVPLIARDGTVYGICGIEVDAMMFKNLYTPNGAEYPRAFTAFAPIQSGGFNTESGLLAGNSYLESRTNGFLSLGNRRNAKSHNDLDIWRGVDNVAYTGMMEPIAIYPTGSPFIEEAWALALLMPLEDWERVTLQSGIFFYGTLIVLLAASLLAALFISRRYIRPIVSALELIKTDDRTSLPKTKIIEINDLLEYLTSLDEERKTLGEENKSLTAELEEVKLRIAADESSADISASAAYMQFLRNLETLTISEHAVFNLYMKNLSAKQIAERLFVSINTIKFHNRNIYSKLGISSLKELKLYVNIMKEAQDR